MGLIHGRTPAGEIQALAVDDDGNLERGSSLPYGANEMVVASSAAAGPTSIQYKRAGVTVKTRTIAYTNGGASASDTVTSITDA